MASTKKDQGGGTIDLRNGCLMRIVGVKIMLLEKGNGAPINFTSELLYVYAEIIMVSVSFN